MNNAPKPSVQRFNAKGPRFSPSPLAMLSGKVIDVEADFSFFVCGNRFARRLHTPLCVPTVPRSDRTFFFLSLSCAGAHKWVVSLQIIYLRDLIHLGYNVIMQDVDIVWLKDVRQYFLDTFYDIEMANDGRFDSKGPGNSGFIHIRSNCKTKVFVDTLLEYIILLLRKNSDQRLWNAMIREYDFRQLIFGLLPPHKFIGGYQWGNGRKRGDRISKDIWMLHASWTTTHFDKITKFKTVSAWFLEDPRCEYLKYPEISVPAHNSPPYVLTEDEKTYVWPEPDDWKSKGMVKKNKKMKKNWWGKPPWL